MSVPLDSHATEEHTNFETPPHEELDYSDYEPVTTSDEPETASEEENNWVADELLTYVDFTDSYTKSKVKDAACDVYFEETKCHICHKCGKSYSYDALMDNYEMNHVKGKRVCCGDCGEPIELALLQRLSNEKTVLDHIKTVYTEKLDTPAFAAYETAIKLLSDKGFIENVTKENETILEFLSALIKKTNRKPPKVRQEISVNISKNIEKMVRLLYEICEDNPSAFDEQSKIVEEICKLPSKYNLGSDTNPTLAKIYLDHYTEVDEGGDITFYRSGDGPKRFYGYSTTVDDYTVLVREKFIGTTTLEEAKRRLCISVAPKIRKIEMPILGMVDLSNAETCLLIDSTVKCAKDNVYLFKVHYQFYREKEITVPSFAYARPYFKKLETAISYAKYINEAASIIQSLDGLEEDYSKEIASMIELLDKNIHEMENELKTTNRLPSEIIGMVHACIEYAHKIPKHMRNAMHYQIHEDFTRHGVDIKVLLDETLNAIFPEADETTKTLIVKTIENIPKCECIKTCPYGYLKSLATSSDNTCECGGPIVENKCILCGITYCEHCHEKKNHNHECSQEKLDTILLINDTTVKCPRCQLRIQKSHGCDHMYCTRCHCNFDWVTGKEISKDQQTNDMFFENMSELESEYNYELGPLLTEYIDHKRRFFDIKGKLCFSLVYEKISSNEKTRRNLHKNLIEMMKYIMNKELHASLREGAANNMDSVLSLLGNRITDYIAGNVCDAVIDKAIEAFQLMVYE